MKARSGEGKYDETESNKMKFTIQDNKVYGPVSGVIKELYSGRPSLGPDPRNNFTAAHFCFCWFWLFGDDIYHFLVHYLLLNLAKCQIILEKTKGRLMMRKKTTNPYNVSEILC